MWAHLVSFFSSLSPLFTLISSRLNPLYLVRRSHTHLHNSPHWPSAIKSSPTHHIVSQFTPHKSLVNHVNPFLKIIRNSSVFRQKPIDKQGESEIRTWIKIWVNDSAATKARLIARSWSANSGDEIQGTWSPTLDLLWRQLSRVILCVGLVFKSQGREGIKKEERSWEYMDVLSLDQK